MDRRATVGIIAVVAVIVIVIAVFALSGTTVTVLESDNGTTVSLSKGDTLEVKLQGNPTTGFNWQTTSIDSQVLQQDGEPLFDAESELIGAPGVVTINYKAVGVGTSPLTLEYGPVAGGNTERTFMITVNVS